MLPILIPLFCFMFVVSMCDGFSWVYEIPFYAMCCAVSPGPNKVEVKKLSSQYQEEVIIGLMLSDGSLRNPNSKKRPTGNCRLEFTFKAPVYDFICWLKFDLLGTLCTESLPTPHPVNNPTQYWFASRSLPQFTVMESLWYSVVNGKRVKIIPDNLVLTPVILAHWIMGDGYWLKSDKAIILCTECFTHKEVLRLIDLLESNLGVWATANRRVATDGRVNYRIRLSGVPLNLRRVRNMVTPHMHKCMLYKLGNRA
jgi:hypothetical protein